MMMMMKEFKDVVDYSSFPNLLGRDVKGHGSEVDTAKTIHTRDDKEDAGALKSAKSKVQDRNKDHESSACSMCICLTILTALN